MSDWDIWTQEYYREVKRTPSLEDFARKYRNLMIRRILDDLRRDFKLDLNKFKLKADDEVRLN